MSRNSSPFLKNLGYHCSTRSDERIVVIDAPLEITLLAVMWEAVRQGLVEFDQPHPQWG